MKTDSACGERQNDGNLLGRFAFSCPSEDLKFLESQVNRRRGDEQAFGKQGMDFLGQPQRQPRFFIKVLGMDGPALYGRNRGCR